MYEDYCHPTPEKKKQAGLLQIYLMSSETDNISILHFSPEMDFYLTNDYKL